MKKICVLLLVLSVCAGLPGCGTGFANRLPGKTEVSDIDHSEVLSESALKKIEQIHLKHTWAKSFDSYAQEGDPKVDVGNKTLPENLCQIWKWEEPEKWYTDMCAYLDEIAEHYRQIDDNAEYSCVPVGATVSEDDTVVTWMYELYCSTDGTTKTIVHKILVDPVTFLVTEDGERTWVLAE